MHTVDTNLRANLLRERPPHPKITIESVQHLSSATTTIANVRVPSKILTFFVYKPLSHQILTFTESCLCTQSRWGGADLPRGHVLYPGGVLQEVAK